VQHSLHRRLALQHSLHKDAVGRDGAGAASAATVQDFPPEMLRTYLAVIDYDYLVFKDVVVVIWGMMMTMIS
jgi:hypothetical protein